jgi:hypothetical protein
MTFQDFYAQTFFPADEDTRTFLSALADDDHDGRGSAPRGA